MVEVGFELHHVCLWKPKVLALWFFVFVFITPGATSSCGLHD